MNYVVVSLLVLSTTIAGFAQTKQIVQPAKNPHAVLPFSPGVISNGFLFVSGQVGTSPQTGKLVEGGIEAETTQTIQNIKTILDAAGVTFDDVVNVTVYLSNMDDFSKMNAIYQTYFKSGSYPARATIGAARLVFGATVEMTMTAAVPTSKTK
jgi:2-iminobutanoate/2-iminopropanoate deaminase